MHHRAACRCGAVAFEVDGDHAGDPPDDSARSAEATTAPVPLDGAGEAVLPAAHTGFGVLWAVPRARIRMRPPEPAIGAFTYSGWLVGHRFCANCGMHLFGEEIVEDGAAAARRMAYVNRECLDAGSGPAGDRHGPAHGQAHGQAHRQAHGQASRAERGADSRPLEPAPSE